MNPHSDPRPSIELVLPSLAVAGMEWVVVRLAIALRERDYAVGITCVDTEGEMAPALRAAGIRVAVVPTAGLRSFLSPALLRRWFAAQAPDIVHVHNVPWFKAALAARQARVPVVVLTQHGVADDDTWIDRLLDRGAVRLCDRVTTVADPLRRYVIESLHADPERVITIPNGVDVEQFAPSAVAGAGLVRASLGLKGAQPLIGMVARLEPIKNHGCLLRAFARVVADHPTARLLLVGDGELRTAIEQQISELGLRGSVVVAGQRSDVADVYRELDICVLPSLSEGASLSLLEAMATGVCIVASEVGGTPELLDRGSCGLLVPVNDSDALARAIGTVIRDVDLRRRLGNAARQRCVEHYASARIVDRYERLYLDEYRESHGGKRVQRMRSSNAGSCPTSGM